MNIGKMHVEVGGFHWVVYPSVEHLKNGRCWATRLPTRELLDPGCAWLTAGGLFVALERDSNYYKVLTGERDSNYYKVLTGEGFVGWIVVQSPEIYFKEVAGE